MHMNTQTKCERCGKENLVKGTLEGVSFVPATKQRKFLSKGVYGIEALVCIECGNLSSLGLDATVLKKLIS